MNCNAPYDMAPRYLSDLITYYCPLAHPAPATKASLLFLKHAQYTPASGPCTYSHCLGTSTWLTPSSSLSLCSNISSVRLLPHYLNYNHTTIISVTHKHTHRLTHYFPFVSNFFLSSAITINMS